METCCQARGCQLQLPIEIDNRCIRHDGKGIMSHPDEEAATLGEAICTGASNTDRNSPPHASGLQPQSSGGLPVASALASPLLVWYTRSSGSFISGRSPVDRAHRSSRCWQSGSAGIPPSRTADPVWLVSAPPRKPSPAGRENPLGFSPSGVSVTPMPVVDGRTTHDH
jgi:hypothetical protein